MRKIFMKGMSLILIIAFTVLTIPMGSFVHGDDVSPTPTPTPVTITLQVGVDGYTNGMDQGAFTEETTDNEQYYGCGQEKTYYFRDGTPQRGNTLIYYDVSQIPTGAAIDSATLSLYDTGLAYDAGTLNIYRMLDANSLGMWVEGSSGDKTFKDGACWARRAGTGNNITAGWTNSANSTVLDSATAVTATINATIGNGWKISTSVVSDVQAWVSGTAVNQGWYVRALPGSGMNIQGMASDQNDTIANRPKLTITYHIGPTSTPGPTSTSKSLISASVSLILPEAAFIAFSALTDKGVTGLLVFVAPLTCLVFELLAHPVAKVITITINNKIVDNCFFLFFIVDHPSILKMSSSP